ncbi:cutinase family protein [Gordonia sp. SID5947]|uniref:cutinase family protein n=1 Tax=Gordonia sp. SID5947 TaxID=2690315 RepID=UPI00136DA446|nr:cutinase family protein [Gordonia sp. SID5947]MYR08995.1 cutinase family protein [Gordonia sp. SID5947]
MLAKVGERLKRDYGQSITVLYPNYPASAFDKGETYSASEGAGVARTQQLMKQCPNSRTILAGYSQGADVAGDVAHLIGHGRGPVECSSVDAVGLLADPKRGNAAVVGPQVKGTGISGSRPGGYGCLSDRMKWLCDPSDLYCNVTSKNPVLRSLGQVLGAPDTGNTTSTSDLDYLTSDYSNVDLAGTTSTASLLKDKSQDLAAPQSSGDAGELAQLGTLASQLVATFTPIADTQAWMKETPGAQQSLTNAPKGSPQAQANVVLDTLGRMDIPGIVRSASAIANTVASAVGGQRSTPTSAARTASPAPAAATTTQTDTPSSTSTDLGSDTPTTEQATTTAPTSVPGVQVPASPGTASTDDSSSPGTVSAAPTGLPLAASGVDGGSTPDLTGLASSALQLATEVAPLNSTDKAALQTASGVLGVIKIDTIVSQGLNVVSAVTDTDYAGIIGNLQRLPAQLFAGDVRGAHRTAGVLNNQFAPWVKMASQIDFQTASQIAAMIPDPQGYAQIVALVLNLVGNVDIVRLARDVGQIQEVGWKVLETGNLLALTQLLPIGLDLASVALGVLKPGQKMSPDLLGAGATDQQAQLATSMQGQDIGAVLGSVSSMATSQGATDLTELIGEGLDAASFLASGSHTSYASKKLVEGKTAIDWLYQFFRKALGG